MVISDQPTEPSHWSRYSKHIPGAKLSPECLTWGLSVWWRYPVHAQTLLFQLLFLKTMENRVSFVSKHQVDTDNTPCCSPWPCPRSGQMRTLLCPLCTYTCRWAKWIFQRLDLGEGGMIHPRAVFTNQKQAEFFIELEFYNLETTILEIKNLKFRRQFT